MNWSNIKLESIIGGKNPDGSSMLESFLLDYAKLTGKTTESLQPGCETCLRKYHNEYKTKTSIMSLESNYKLQKRFEGLPLNFGSNILLTNSNLTDDYAEQKIAQYIDIYEAKGEEYHPKDHFAEYPENWADAHYEDAPEEEVKEIKPQAENVEANDSDLSLSELREKYPDISARSQKKFLEKLAQSEG